MAGEPDVAEQATRVRRGDRRAAGSQSTHGGQRSSAGRDTRLDRPRRRHRDRGDARFRGGHGRGEHPDDVWAGVPRSHGGAARAAGWLADQDARRGRQGHGLGDGHAQRRDRGAPGEHVHRSGAWRAGCPAGAEPCDRQEIPRRYNFADDAALWSPSGPGHRRERN